MVTLNQLVYSYIRKKKLKKVTRPALMRCPQKKAICVKVFVMSPKKPNSARRKVVRVRIMSTNRFVTCHIPGEGHNLQEHSIIAIHGGRAKDLPGVKYRVIRGVESCMFAVGRKRALSKYGKPEELKSNRHNRRRQ